MTRAAELLDLCRASLAAAGEPHAEVWLRARRRGHARFSVSELSQHMDLDETEARVRVARGLRVGEIALTDHDRDALAAAIAQAATLATTAPEQHAWPGFAGSARYTPCIRFAEATARASAAERAELVARVIGRIGAEGLASAGVLETTTTSVAIATTAGCAAADDGTRAQLRLWALTDARGRGASGHASHLVRDVRDLAVDRLVEQAARAAKDGADPGAVEAGTWDVVLEPTAVAELLEWLAAITFAAPDVDQGTSVLADGLGRPITGASIDLADDPLADDGFAEPFDREGTPRRRVQLVERGIGRAFLTDRVHAARAGAESTGSAVLPGFGTPDGIGAIAFSLGGGEAASSEELVSGMDRGLWIRRLHYVNGYLEPKRAVMTGLSRDGCFLVERGRVVRAVGNVRLTDSFLEMLARADAMTRTREVFPCSWVDGGTVTTPAVRFRSVRFSAGSR